MSIALHPPIDFAGIRREAAEIADEAQQIIAEILLSGRVLQGPAVTVFEEQIARFCGRKHAVCVGSGTDALYFAMIASGIGPGDDVLVPDVSFIATAAAVLRTGARPVFVDIGPSCHLDLEQAQLRISPRTRAMLFVNLFGSMTDPERVEAFGRRHGITIIEDAAQSFGACFGARRSGAVGAASVLSFDPMKVLSAPGSGGAVLTDDDALADEVRLLRYHGRSGGRFVRLGFNSQLPSLSAALLSLKLHKAPIWLCRRQQAAEQMADAFRDLPISIPEIEASSTHAWQKFVLLTDRRDELMRHLAGAGVPSMIHYPRPLHREPMFEPASDCQFERACLHAARTMSLPIHGHLDQSEIARIIAAMRQFFSA